MFSPPWSISEALRTTCCTKIQKFQAARKSWEEESAHCGGKSECPADEALNQLKKKFTEISRVNDAGQTLYNQPRSLGAN